MHNCIASLTCHVCVQVRILSTGRSCFHLPGNLMVVPVIKTIGLTMGLTVWGLTNMLTGWFTGVSVSLSLSLSLPPSLPPSVDIYTLFVSLSFRVILQEKVDCSPLNYGGVAVVLIRLASHHVSLLYTHDSPPTYHYPIVWVEQRLLAECMQLNNYVCVELIGGVPPHH